MVSVTPLDEERIVRLKGVSPDIALQIKRLETAPACEFYVKRLEQLAGEARSRLAVLREQTSCETMQECVH